MRMYCAANWVFLLALGFAAALFYWLVDDLAQAYGGAVAHERLLITISAGLAVLLLVGSHALVFWQAKRRAIWELKVDLAKAQQDGYASGLQQARSERQADLDKMLRTGLTIGAAMTPLCRERFAQTKFAKPGEPIFPFGSSGFGVGNTATEEGKAA